MILILRIILVSLLFCTSVSAGDWSKEDQQRQLLFTVLHIADWNQTLQTVDNPNYYEQNGIIGRNPSRSRVNSVMAIFLVGHWFIAKYLTTGKNRKKFQWITISIKGLVVRHNRQIGLFVFK